jgi:hypothetical protein
LNAGADAAAGPVSDSNFSGSDSRIVEVADASSRKVALTLGRLSYQGSRYGPAAKEFPLVGDLLLPREQRNRKKIDFALLVRGGSARRYTKRAGSTEAKTEVKIEAGAGAGAESVPADDTAKREIAGPGPVLGRGRGRGRGTQGAGGAGAISVGGGQSNQNTSKNSSGSGSGSQKDKVSSSGHAVGSFGSGSGSELMTAADSAKKSIEDLRASYLSRRAKREERVWHLDVGTSPQQTVAVGAKFGRMLPFPDGTFGHANCVRWCPEVVERKGEHG